MPEKMVQIQCPECAAPDNDAVLLTVPESALAGGHEVIKAEERKPGDRLYVCDRCPTCQKRYCVKLLRRVA